ncbi:hypothetical protein [Aliiroseovarius sp. F47248L]|uniref:hypothetical protein n=1 Tax=Aliiroseovarius sp. F47248L TaxID=2926420 RepID=UPI001FF1741C|nr:hypothetical protein [Aliiroseovarius sp. F47248L]MCK0139274.1 hypothetical protein [Aliiroseovarius sp. F47248L]
MIKENKWSRANRNEKVLNVTVVELPVGDLMRPKLESLSEGDAEDVKVAVRQGLPLWSLHVVSQEGFNAARSTFYIFASLEQAKEKSASFPVGTYIDNFGFPSNEGRAFELGKLSVETRLSSWGRGEGAYGLAYEALHGAGVYENYKLSKEVLEWLGSEGEDWLRSDFGENWEAVAAMEYCVRNFHSTSMACIAARIFMSEFVAESDFDAGYASRELEVLAGGVEGVASKALAAQARRTKGSGLKSQRQKQERLEVFMQAIEALKDIVGSITEERVLAQAWENVIATHESMPKTKKTRFEYEVILRSEEPFKTRYYAIFG